jgi:hypothetical protein
MLQGADGWVTRVVPSGWKYGEFVSEHPMSIRSHSHGPGACRALQANNLPRFKIGAGRVRGR